MAIEIEQFMCRQDNFGVLMRDSGTGEVALVDAPEGAPILAAIGRTGWVPSRLFVTHHHGDHVAANLALKERFGLRIVGPEAEKDRIPGIDETVEEGSRIPFGGETIEVIATPGHTAGHVSYHLPGSKMAFTADTLFALGCGRLFECPPPVMFESLKKLAALPARAKEIEALRAQDKATLPTTIGAELETNPFLRWGDAAIRKHLGMENASDVEVFAEIRRRKDDF
jgi:hydroxyacylglutathione hydrolase